MTSGFYFVANYRILQMHPPVQEIGQNYCIQHENGPINTVSTKLVHWKIDLNHFSRFSRAFSSRAEKFMLNSTFMLLAEWKKSKAGMQIDIKTALSQFQCKFLCIIFFFAQDEKKLIKSRKPSDSSNFISICIYYHGIKRIF